jgi:hypothetical protein
MDFYGTASTAIDQVVKVTIFIKGVISDIKSYEDDRGNIQLKLDLQLATLEFFRRRFVDEGQGLLLPGRLPDWIADAICKLLLNMAKVLSEYRALAAEYDAFDVAQAGSSGESTKQSLLERAKAKAKNLKVKGYNWSLFDKQKLQEVLADYKEWTDSLRDLMQHFSQEHIYSITDAVSSMNSVSLEGTGLEEVAKRQKLASSQAPADFRALEGEIVLEEDGKGPDPFQLASWKRGGAEPDTAVVIEYHPYDRKLRYGDLDPEEIAELKAPVRNLSWLLQNATFSYGDDEDEPTSAQQPTIYSLQCLGYMDQPEKERMVFLYKLPSAQFSADNFAEPDDVVNQCPVTLHELVNTIDSKTKRPFKPSLGERFRIAHCLALTLSNVHGSAWVHKNIWSRGILLFQHSDDGLYPLTSLDKASSNDSGQTSLLAFLGHWGYARPIDGATEMRSDFEIEPNFYRHPDRQGLPTRQFSRAYDIYALGVVLLEIGLWKTISQLFSARIKDAQRTGKLPKPRDVRNALVTLAQKEVAKEMGEAYAAAVVQCLEGTLRSSSDLELSFDFKAKVIDVLSPGMKL